MVYRLSEIWSKQALRCDAHVSRTLKGFSESSTNGSRHELASRLARDPELSHVSVVGLDPGAMGSDLTRRGGFLMTTVGVRWLLPLMAPIAVKFNPNGLFRPLWKSAGDAVRLCFEVEVPAGKLLYLNGTDELDTGRESKNVANRNALWAYGLEAAQIKQGDTILRDWK